MAYIRFEKLPDLNNSFILKILSLIFISLIVLGCAPGIKKTLKKEKIFNQGFTGLLVYNPANKKALLDFNSSKYFTPASNTKILTFYSAINYLEDSIPSISYTITGDSLIFSATGDPGFLNPAFSNHPAFEFLKSTNKTLFYKPSDFRDEVYGPGWAWDDYPYSFSSGKAAFPIYGNLVHLNIDKLKGIQVLPAYFKDSLEITNNTTSRLMDKNIFLVDISKGDYPRKIPFIPSQKLSLELLRDSLKKPIEVIDHNQALENTLYSMPSDSLYKHMLHYSDNFIAEQLLLMVAKKVSDSLDSEIAINRIQKEHFNTFQNEIKWVDGSGLSRYNLLTPSSMVEILERILNKKGRDYVLDLFPTAGMDGTLKNFLTGEKPFVYAKSGTLRHNYSLSGFLITKKGKLLIFSFMNSNYPGSTSELKPSMEEILKRIRDKF